MQFPPIKLHIQRPISFSGIKLVLRIRVFAKTKLIPDDVALCDLSPTPVSGIDIFFSFLVVLLPDLWRIIQIQTLITNTNWYKKNITCFCFSYYDGKRHGTIALTSNVNIVHWKAILTCTYLVLFVLVTHNAVDKRCI